MDAKSVEYEIENHQISKAREQAVAQVFLGRWESLKLTDKFLLRAWLISLSNPIDRREQNIVIRT